MNNKLNNAQIARIFAPYIGQKVLTVKGKNQTYMLIRVGIGSCAGYFDDRKNLQYDSQKMYTVSNFILKLKPLSLITKEDFKKMGEIALSEKDKFSIINQFLISRGYAVPLYFGPDHELNGKTAIEIGIAVSAEN